MNFSFDSWVSEVHMKASQMETDQILFWLSRVFGIFMSEY